MQNCLILPHEHWFLGHFWLLLFWWYYNFVVEIKCAVFHSYHLLWLLDFVNGIDFAQSSPFINWSYAIWNVDPTVWSTDSRLLHLELILNVVAQVLDSHTLFSSPGIDTCTSCLLIQTLITLFFFSHAMSSFYFRSFYILLLQFQSWKLRYHAAHCLLGWSKIWLRGRRVVSFILLIVDLAWATPTELLWKWKGSATFWL